MQYLRSHSQLFQAKVMHASWIGIINNFYCSFNYLKTDFLRPVNGKLLFVFMKNLKRLLLSQTGEYNISSSLSALYIRAMFFM